MRNKKSVTGKMLLSFDSCCHIPQVLSSPNHCFQVSPIQCKKIADVKGLGLSKIFKCPGYQSFLKSIFMASENILLYRYMCMHMCMCTHMKDSTKHGL